MTKDVCVNEVYLTGKVITEAVNDHSVKDINFLKFFVSNTRLSGTEDKLPVIISAKVLQDLNIEIAIGKIVSISGEYRSYRDPNSGKLNLFVFAKGIRVFNEQEAFQNSNYVRLEAYVCKASDVRITPKGRRIVDVMVAVNRGLNKSSYIPCIIWNLSDAAAREIKAGDKITLTGRMQSRNYQKVVDDGTIEVKTAYEVSVSKYSITSVESI